MLTCTLYQATDLPHHKIALWQDMIAQTPQFASPLLSPQFALAVAAVRQDVRVAVWRRSGQAVGFMAFHKRPNRFARPVGAPFSDYSALITFPEPGFGIAEALQAAGIDRLHVTGLLDPHGVFAGTTGTTNDAYALDISGDDPGNNVVKKLAKNINRLRRHVAEQLGEPYFVVGDRNPQHFETMLALKRAQVAQTGLHDFLAQPWVQTLMRNLFEAPDTGLHGCMVTLMAGETPLLYHFGPRLGERAHPWVSSFDPTYSAFSPGQIFLNDCRLPLKAAGVTWYDLSTGQQHYKPAFCNHHTLVSDAMVFGASSSARVQSRFLTLARRVQRVSRPVDHLLNRIDRRMDTIASLELKTTDRLRGFAHAVTTAKRRKSDHG